MISLTADEIEEMAPLVDTVERATRAFDEDGWVGFENAFAKKRIEALRGAFFEQYGALGEEELAEIGSRVGHERFMFAPALEPPFFDPHIYANPYVLAVVRALLGDDYVLDSFAFVVAYPGAKDQHLHLDHSLLFPEDETTSLAVPPYALTVVIPLVDLGEKTGSTRLFERSSTAEPSLWKRLMGGHVVEAKAGCCWLMDYRIAHGGTPNPSQIPRPILYLVYARKWFVDSENFESRPPLRLPGEVPEPYRGLFRRGRANSGS